MIRTVLGDIGGSEIRVALCHEHICCYNDDLLFMSGSDYLDKEQLCERAISGLTELREEYGLNLFVDCSSTNLGRDIELMKRISEKSRVHIVASTGMYYFSEDMLAGMSAETLAKHYIKDAVTKPIGAIKAAVEFPIAEDYSDFNGTFAHKALTAAAITQVETGLPIILHTNARNKNGLPALKFLTGMGVNPDRITVGHLSDTDDVEYLKEIASFGCFLGLDRFYFNETEEYIGNKVRIINELCSAGFADSIILSHDEQFFNSFEAEPAIKEKTRFHIVLKHILPRLDSETADTVIRKNPVRCMSI